MHGFRSQRLARATHPPQGASVKGGPVRDRRGTRFTLEERGAADSLVVLVKAQRLPKAIWFLVKR